MKIFKTAAIGWTTTLIAQAVAALDSPVFKAKNGLSADGELLLYGIIGDWWDGLDAKTIVTQMEQMSGDTITIRINSPGGNVVEGLAMYNRLKQSPKRVVAYIDGLAASMGCAIAMAADEVIIPSNALMMMHKPSVRDVDGNDEDLREMADELAQLENAYIQLHVDKTGKSFDEIKALIGDRKNHFFRGQEAIDYGLADTLISPVQLEAAACAVLDEFTLPDEYKKQLIKTAAAVVSTTEEENEMIKIKAVRGGWHFVPAVSAALNGTFGTVKEAVAELGKTIKATNLAEILEGKAECELSVLEAIAKHFDITVASPVAGGNDDEGDPALTGAQAVAAERLRSRDLRSIAAQAKVDDKELTEWLDGGITVAEARAKALDIIAARDSENAPTSHLRVGGSVGAEGFRAAMTNALLNRVAPGRHALTENGREFRGMQLSDMIAASLELAGQSTRGKTRSELVAVAMHTTSDFPLVLQDVANKTLRDAYAEAPLTYKMISSQTSASDFKTKHSVQIGGGSSLSEVNESGEFKNGTVSESAESYKLKTYGKIFNFTRQLLINDDLSALTRFMSQIGMAAGRKENYIVWALIKSNPNLTDGVAFYSTNTARKNQFTGSGVTATELSAGRKLLRQMKGLDDEALNVTAKYLVVNSERETAAQQILAAVRPDSATNVNPFARSMELIVEPELDGVTNNPWYMFADPMALPCVEHCYLDGESGPYIETKWGFEVDGMSLKVRHDFGAGLVDFRGTAKCTGA